MQNKKVKINGIIKFYLYDELIALKEYTSRLDRKKMIDEFLARIEKLKRGRIFSYTIEPNVIVLDDVERNIEKHKAKRGYEQGQYGNINKTQTQRRLLTDKI